ncbi:hypothetical protein HOH45_01955 [bacterium]|nr:hypothetical protein [bacterium]
MSVEPPGFIHGCDSVAEIGGVATTDFNRLIILVDKFEKKFPIKNFDFKPYKILIQNLHSHSKNKTTSKPLSNPVDKFEKKFPIQDFDFESYEFVIQNMQSIFKNKTKS